jgi:putative superfamily III holin-X
MAEDFNNADGFVDQVKEYVNIRLSQLKLLFAEKTSKVMAVIIAVVLSALVFFLFFVLICIAGAIAIGQWLESFWLGFLIVAGIVLLAGFILWMSKDSLIRKPIMNALIKIMFDDKDENEKD